MYHRFVSFYLRLSIRIDRTFALCRFTLDQSGSIKVKRFFQLCPHGIGIPRSPAADAMREHIEYEAKFGPSSPVLESSAAERLPVTPGSAQAIYLGGLRGLPRPPGSLTNGVT